MNKTINSVIIQWAILAIRNICEDNPENQKLIAGMHQEGVAISEVLDEMGITLHSDIDNNSLKIVPLDSLRNNSNRNNSN
ncbi:hypothetical protein NQ318_009530 [Aromia moschata]|uniref:Ataxin-10 domain-containing protein n=1 Tax=Aromia moschata TaxID=1265417 RepID=A0AAV8XE16_9CUCU|nr:hypothetical protein NQ318_009530 [Aromia moschata]